MAFNSLGYNKVAFRKTFKPMVIVTLIAMVIFILPCLALFIPDWIVHGIDYFSIFGIITWCLILITFVIIYFIFQRIWVKQLLAKQLTISDDEMIEEYKQFKDYIMSQERPNVAIDELSTNKLFRIRNRTSKQDIEKRVKKALCSKNQLEIIYVLFEAIDFSEWSKTDKIAGLDIKFTDNNYQLIILKNFFDTVEEIKNVAK